MHALAVVPDFHIDCHAFFNGVFVVDDAANGFGQVALFRFGEESDVSQVHANERNAGSAYHFCGTKNRTIATEHHAEFNIDERYRFVDDLHGDGLVPVFTQGLQIGASHDGREPRFVELGACLSGSISCFFAPHVGEDENLTVTLFHRVFGTMTFETVVFGTMTRTCGSYLCDCFLRCMAFVFCHNDSLPSGVEIGVLRWCIYPYHTEYVLEDFLKYHIFRKLFRIAYSWGISRYLRKIPVKSACA